MRQMRFHMKKSPKSTPSVQIRRLTLAAIFAALICVATMVIQIPSPMSGYVNLGDAFVLLAAFLLSFPYGAAAAGIGSALADVFTGYLHYAPGTFVIKGGMAIAAGLIYSLCRRKKIPTAVSAVLAGVTAEAIMVLGYFLYAWLLLGKGLAAASSIPGNVVQGIVGCTAAVLLSVVLEKKRGGKGTL